MSWSLGEVHDLCLKATRGAGYSWGMAEEAGWAVRWLAERGLPGPKALAGLIAARDGVCPVGLGASIADFGQPDLAANAGRIAQPLLLLPFVARRAAEGSAFEVTLGDVPAVIWADGARIDGDCPPEAEVTISGTVPAPDGAPSRTRVEVIAGDALQVLNDFAGRTYAPATEESRMRGAGAGVTDND